MPRIQQDTHSLLQHIVAQPTLPACLGRHIDIPIARLEHGFDAADPNCPQFLAIADFFHGIFLAYRLI